MIEQHAHRGRFGEALLQQYAQKRREICLKALQHAQNKMAQPNEHVVRAQTAKYGNF
ncbi:MAG: hypothetical protein QNK37_05415 [Acidobacteriota bacterium]|nr:hypothetical protein [Acidobacteriota bacterium]